MNPLLQLQNEGVSVWLDNLSREFVAKGDLKKLIDEDGLRGETSNPSIFQKSITEGNAYDAQIVELARKDQNAEAICWELMVTDVRSACDVFRTLFDASHGEHGHVSLEVSPLLALDTEAEIKQGRELWGRVDRPNVFIKVPATTEGLPVIETLLYQGINVNVTLLFSVERYGEVIDAWFRAMERRAAEGKALAGIESVASFFVSRVDTEADKRLDKIGGDRAKALQGKIAVANAQVAYDLYEQRYSGDRWEALKAKGARAQRPLWASTSTKNPAYPDTLYVADLIAPNTVNTMPDDTIAAFRDHGVVKRTITAGAIRDAHATLKELAAVGVDLDDVCLKTLVDEGVKKFADAYNSLLGAVRTEREKLLSKA